MYITIPNTAKHARYRGSARGESHTSVARITGASRQQCHRVGRRRLKFRAVPHTHRQRRIGALRTAPPRATAPAASAIGGLVKSPARARWVQQRRVGAHCRQRAAWRARSCQRRQPRRERVRRRARQVWRRAQHVRRVQRAACQPVQRHHSRRTRCGVALDGAKAWCQRELAAAAQVIVISLLRRKAPQIAVSERRRACGASNLGTLPSCQDVEKKSFSLSLACCEPVTCWRAAFSSPPPSPTRAPSARQPAPPDGASEARLASGAPRGAACSRGGVGCGCRLGSKMRARAAALPLSCEWAAADPRWSRCAPGDRPAAARMRAPRAAGSGGKRREGGGGDEASALG